MVAIHKPVHHTKEEVARTLPLPHDPSYPDSLDFLLHSVYNNAREFNTDKAGIRVQPESSVKHTKA
ncbi:hypothetical protein RvY_13865 [Ramazzottius varieornatus]|uniref:Uncharacterized protein n=1 Tax=Ramazzottius varieornatus TaxID=947166 RepID=A0A1D1VPC5_RAMVA|nr:hypothetical protein RvY_13865 [Ramazzottius varieornatus]